ncbi:MAG: flagellar accessory protein FlaH [Dehalococcoidia bacterium]|nr:flagellar accessory protein FlaH [Dehalococcoidia bacterium]
MEAEEGIARMLQQDPQGEPQQELQQEPQQEQPAPAEEPKEEEEEEEEEEEARKRLITVGVMDIDKRLVGGLPQDSLTLVEGDPDAGKSVVIQQLTFGALKEGFKAALFLSESSPREFLDQMDSLGMSSVDYYLIGRLSLYKRDLRVSQERADNILRRLLRHIEDSDRRDLFIVDSITPLLFQFDERYVLSFLANCKNLADMGRTIIVTLHSYAIGEALRFRADSIVDAHLRLRIEELGKQLVHTLEVAKIRGAMKTADNAVSFTVQPGMGLKSVPISKTRA